MERYGRELPFLALVFFEVLFGLKSLRFLEVNSSTNLSESAIDHLRNSLPAIETLRTGEDDDMHGMGGGVG